MKFRKKLIVINAPKWTQNGDHPQDDCHMVSTTEGEPFKSEGKIVRYYRAPELDGQNHCARCNKIMHEHGWIDTPGGGHIVCAGDRIVTGVSGEHYPGKKTFLGLFTIP